MSAIRNKRNFRNVIEEDDLFCYDPTSSPPPNFIPKSQNSFKEFKRTILRNLSSNSAESNENNTGCKCGTGKKSCSKSTKCTCRQRLSHCTIACKCQCDCSNNKIRLISKQIKQTFLTPDETGGEMGLILRLTGENNYSYQTEFIGSCEAKPRIHAAELMYECLMTSIAMFRSLPVNHITVLLSRSPCFHQDCDPKCEVLQTCMEQKACARLLAVSYAQIQKHLGNCHIQMSVKFLTPYVRRGDLYTQQGIMQMMEAGITVEPIVLQDWGRIIISPGQAFAGGMANETRNMTGYDSGGEGTSTNPAAVINDPALALWAQQTMDTHVRRSQHYINACRCSLGLKPHYWSSPFHDLLQTTVLTCALTERRISAILHKLGQLAPYSTCPNSMTTSICSSMVFNSDNNPSQRPPMQSSKSMDACIAQISHVTLSPRVALSQSVHSSLANHVSASANTLDPRCSYEGVTSQMSDNTTTINDYTITETVVEEEHDRRTLTGSPNEEEHETANIDTSGMRDVVEQINNVMPRNTNKHMHGDPIDKVERVLAGFSGRNLGESEREEIQEQLHKTLSKISNNLNSLFQYLQDRSTSTTI